MDKILGNVFNVVPVRGILSIYCILALRQPDAFNVCGVGVFFVAVGYICEIRELVRQFPPTTFSFCSAIVIYYFPDKKRLRVGFNPLTAKLFNLNFHPPEVLYRLRDPQLHVSENHSDLTKWR